MVGKECGAEYDRHSFNTRICRCFSLNSLAHGVLLVERYSPKLAEQHPEIIFLKANFDENKSLCKSLNIKVLPFFHFYRGTNGLVDSFSCSLAKLQKLKDAIATHNKVLHSDNPSVYNGGASDLPGLSVAPDDKPL